MPDEDIYLSSRADEADRLADASDDPRVQLAHEKFATAYRDRLTKACGPEDEEHA